MKKIKVFYMGERLRDVYPHATKWQVFKFRVRKFFTKVAFISVAVVATVAMVFILDMIHGSKVQIERHEVMVYAEEINEIPPVMQRIAQCESGNSHYDKNGQVLLMGNSNKTVDIGIFQVNEYYWGAEAAELGYDLTVEEDNIDFAVGYLYYNYGTEPWIHSKNCWN